MFVTFVTAHPIIPPYGNGRYNRAQTGR